MKGNKESLLGRTCLVTGATSGHGKAMAHGLAKLGADLVLLGRNPEKLHAVRAELESENGQRPEMLICDLSSQSEIRRAAEEFLSWKRPLHILVNNAGLVNQKRRVTGDGIEETFAVNYLSMFLMTNLLLERIKESAPARIINISSDTHRMVRLVEDDPEGKRGRYSLMGAYGRSKLAIVYFTVELSRRLSGTGVTVNAVDPGPIASGIADKSGIIPRLANAVIQLTFPDPQRAARTALYLASSSDLINATGGYYRFMKRKEPSIKNMDPQFPSRFWNISEEMTGLSCVKAKSN